MRLIKFRVWDKTNNEWWWQIFNLQQDGNFYDGNNQGLDEDVIIQQYIGLLDKNGKDIYEGDVIKTYSENREYIGVIEWSNESLSFRLKEIPNIWLSNRTIEVIGNIYENPELLTN